MPGSIMIRARTSSGQRTADSGHHTYSATHRMANGNDGSADVPAKIRHVVIKNMPVFKFFRISGCLGPPVSPAVKPQDLEMIGKQSRQGCIDTGTEADRMAYKRNRTGATPIQGIKNAAI